MAYLLMYTFQNQVQVLLDFLRWYAHNAAASFGKGLVPCLIFTFLYLMDATVDFDKQFGNSAIKICNHKGAHPGYVDQDRMLSLELPTAQFPSA